MFEKLFYIKMKIDDDKDLTEEEIDNINDDLNLSGLDIEEMIQEWLEFRDYDSIVDVEVYDSCIQDGQLTYEVCYMPE